MLNAFDGVETHAHDSISAHGYPQKMWTKGGTFTACFCPAVFLCEGAGGSVFAARGGVAASKEILWLDSGGTYYEALHLK